MAQTLSVTLNERVFAATQRKLFVFFGALNFLLRLTAIVIWAAAPNAPLIIYD